MQNSLRKYLEFAYVLSVSSETRKHQQPNISIAFWRFSRAKPNSTRNKFRWNGAGNWLSYRWVKLGPWVQQHIGRRHVERDNIRYLERNKLSRSTPYWLKTSKRMVFNRDPDWCRFSYLIKARFLIKSHAKSRPPLPNAYIVLTKTDTCWAEFHQKAIKIPSPSRIYTL